MDAGKRVDAAACPRVRSPEHAKHCDHACERRMPASKLGKNFDLAIAAEADYAQMTTELLDSGSDARPMLAGKFPHVAQECEIKAFRAVVGQVGSCAPTALRR